MSSNGDDQLNFLAMRYVLGELSESDRDAFEARLVDDLAACEAVAEASLLRLNINAALAETKIEVRPHQISNAVSSRSLFAVGTSISTVACLVLAMTVWPIGINDPGVSRSPVVELAARWRTAMKPADVELDESEDELQDVSADIAVPDWLFAALSVEDRASFEVDPEERKNN